MREIKFRGIVKYNGNHLFSGNWVEGFYFYDAKEDKHYIKYTELLNETFIRTTDIEVLPETVGQSTGLFDKNGVEIYEGYILKGDWSIVDDIEVGVVEFYGGAFRFKPAGLPLEYGYYRKECEIIGNIYEHPELLEPSEK